MCENFSKNFFISFISISVLYLLIYLINLKLQNNILIISMIFLWLIFFIIFSDNSDKYVEYYVVKEKISKKQTIIFILKISFVCLFIILAQYFLYKHKILLGHISYFFAYVQTLLLVSKKNIYLENNEKNIKIKTQREQLKKTIENKNINIKILIFSGVLISIFYAYLFAIKERVGLFLFFIMIIIFLLRFVKDNINITYAQYNKKQRFYKIDFFILTAIIIIAYFVRTYKLLDYPPGIIKDQTNLLLLYESMKNGYNPPMYLAIPYYHATLHAKILIFISNLLKFKINIFTVNYFHAVIGVINVLFIVLISYELFSRRVAIIAGIIITFMMEHLLFSRNGGPMILTMTAASASFYFYFVGLRKNNIFLMLLSGIFLGLGIYFYTPGRAAPFVYIFYWIGLLLFIKDKKVLIYDLRMSLIMVISSFIVFVPLLDFIIKYPDIYFERINQVNMLNTWKNSKNLLHDLIAQFFVYFNFFFNKSSWRGIYSLPSKPVFDIFTNIFFISGISIFLFNIKKRNYSFIFVWFLVGMLVGFFSGAMDIFPARLILALPVISIIIAIGIDGLIRIIESIIKTKILSVLLTIFIILIISSINYKMFFLEFPNDLSVKYTYNHKYKILYDEVKKYKNIEIIASKYFLSQQEANLLHYWLKVLNKDAKYIDVSLYEFSNFYNNKRKNILIIAEGLHYKNLFYLKTYFPDIKIKRIWNYDYFVYKSGEKYCKEKFGWKKPEFVLNGIKKFYDVNKFDSTIPYCNFVLIYIPYKDIKNLFTLNLKVYTDNEIINKKLSSTSIFLNKKYKKVVISNIIEFPEYGKYDIIIKGTKKYKIFIDNKNFNKNKKYAKGLHRIKIIIYSENENIQLIWKTPVDKEKKLIPIKYFINSSKIYGLLEKTFDSENKLCYEEIVPVLQFNNFFYHTRPPLKKCRYRNNNCKTIWEGFLKTEESGKYYIYLNTYWYSKVYIDGKLVSEKKEYAKPDIKAVYLKKGKHEIRIESKTLQEETITRLLWKKEGENIFYDCLPDRLTVLY